MTIDLSALIGVSLAGPAGDEVLAFAGRWYSRGWLARTAGVLNRVLEDMPAAGLVARNRPHHIAAFAANLAARRMTSMIYAAQGSVGLATDIHRLNLPAIIADSEDWSKDALAAASETGSMAIATWEDGADPAILLPRGNGPFRTVDPAIGLELLSSGTTGLPKRIPLRWTTIADVVEGAADAYAGSASDAPQVMVHPLGNVAGLSYAAPPLVFGRQLVLLEKFAPQAWAAAVRDYRPMRGSIPPAGVAMLIDSAVPREWLSSLALVAVGGGKLDPALQIAFEERFGIPVLPAFGATEFGGVIANWSLDTYRDWGVRKRGSAGRASAGVTLRVVDREDFSEMPPGAIGLMEARVPRIGPDWIRTNDLASIDADGFLFLHGRADGAINRGGFKIVPEIVVAALAGHAAVAESAVVGIPDARLGEVPVAAVELRPDARASTDDLRGWLKDRLVAYQVPVHIRIVPALPRNASMKVALGEVRALFEQA
jgi:acyl-coenzyme A synthetase/AMP-(fatty) acid ligase